MFDWELISFYSFVSSCEDYFFVDSVVGFTAESTESAEIFFLYCIMATLWNGSSVLLYCLGSLSLPLLGGWEG